MDGQDRKELARAAYERLDRDLREEKREWLWALVVALAAFGGASVFLYATSGTGPEELVDGTVVRTVHIPDDEEHVVHLAVELDDGETASVRQDDVLPIGARVTLSRRKSWFGAPRYRLAERR